MQTGSSGLVVADAVFNAVAPEIGLGYVAVLSRHWRFDADIGALYTGGPHLTYRMTGPFTVLPSVPLDAERVREDLHRQFAYPVLPLVMAGIGYAL